MSVHPLKNSLLRLSQDPNWRAVIDLAGRLQASIAQKRVSGDTIDSIGIQAIEKQSQVDGIKRFLEEISSIAAGERDTE